MDRNSKSSLIALMFIAVLFALCSACASIGRPEGGPRDENPPVFVNSRPLPGSLNVSSKKIDIYFDENVQIEDAFNKVIVSPVQKQAPAINANGKHVSVELRDSLIPNTTYTIDFADAIKDLNEGNILDGFAVDFSTGAEIDTLRISGMVFEARNLEPAQGMLVGLYSNLADSAIRTLPLERIARTDQYGRFTIRNLKPGTYRVFALNDVNRDNHWDRTENIAFLDSLISPFARPIIVTDTLRGSADADSIVTRPGVAYLPNDVLLTWFNEEYKAQYLKDYARPDRRRITIGFAAPSDTLPSLSIAKGEFEGLDDSQWGLRNANATRDSLEFWIKHPGVLATDSLWVAMRYLKTDSLENLSWTTDTLKFFFKEPKKKSNKQSKDSENDSVPQIEFLSFNAITQSSHDVYNPLIFSCSQPIDTILHEAVHLQMLRDTLWTDIPGVVFRPDSLRPHDRRLIDLKWDPGARYRLTVDSAAVFGIYGEWNKPITHEFTVKNLEDYSNLTLAVSPITSHAIVELLNTSDVVVRTAPLVDGKAIFKYVNPGTYYARLFLDANDNGTWDTGSLIDSLQPEEVYYYPKKLNLRKNWDIDQSWNIYEVALDKQKPYDLKKNKPKLKKGETEPRYDDEDDEYDELADPFDNRSGRNNRNGSRNNGSRNSGFGGFSPGGIRQDTGGGYRRR